MLLVIYHLLSVLAMVCTADQCERIYSVPDRILTNHVIRTILQEWFHDCVYICEEELNCYSTNYFISNSTCQLNSATAQRHLIDFVAWPNAVYIGSLVRKEAPVPVGSPCDQRSPPCDGFCSVATGSLVSTCVCLNSDLTTCQPNACRPQALGMENKLIPDSDLSASSTHSSSSLAKARLNSVDAWTPNTDDQNQWFNISFGLKSKVVTRIDTQGHSSYWYWTKEFKIQYKFGANNLEFYKDSSGQIKIFSGNTKHENTIVTNSFRPPITTDSIKILPVSWSGRIALRIELYGCDMAQ